MSSTRISAWIAATLAVACLTACASHPAADPHVADIPITPTQRYAPVITQTPDQILLAPHASGLSVAQTAAVDALAARWREAGGGPITIEPPAGGGAAAYRVTEAVEARLLADGLREGQIKVTQEGAVAENAVAVGYSHFEADGPRCGRDWSSFTHTADNAVNSNFGCATTANFAAMVANPADLAGPRPMEPADAARRQQVISKYRNGQVTSTNSDTQATGHVSTAVN
jgi:pilus assembly protein CpaD